MLSRQTITWKPIKPLEPHSTFPSPHFINPLHLLSLHVLLLSFSISPSLSLLCLHLRNQFTLPSSTLLSPPPPSLSCVSLASAEGHSSRTGTKRSLFSVAELWVHPFRFYVTPSLIGILSYEPFTSFMSLLIHFVLMKFGVVCAITLAKFLTVAHSH